MPKFITSGRARQDNGGPSSDSQRASWETTRRGTSSQLSYASKVTFSMLGVALVTAALLALILFFSWEGQFNSYTRSNMESIARAAAEAISAEYQKEGGWTEGVLEYAESVTRISSDIGIQILDENDEIIFDDTWATSEPPAILLEALGSNTTLTSADVRPPRVSLAPTSTESVVSTPIKIDDRRIGTVRLWAFGSDALLTKSDAAFRTASYRAIATATILATLVALVIGVVLSRSTVAPIKRITSTAQQIRNGDLTARTGLSGSDELGQLGETFDDMASTLERDIALEHRLTSDVAHELRTPLMAMQAMVEAMQDGVLPCDEERLATVGGEVRRLSRLVDAMLQLSRMENGTAPFNPEKTDIAELVRNLVISHEQLFVDNELELFFDDGSLDENGEPREIYAEVDRDMINQALTNLMSNALRYTPEGGRVVVTVSEDKNDATISIADTGMGISPEDLSRVFGRFWRSDASRERVSGGLGVGLALTKQIVDTHHGYISVSSEVDKGTTFVVHIPHKYKEAQTAKRSSATMN